MSFFRCCCTSSTFTLNLIAKSCGNVAYNGVAMAVKSGSTTVATCTTAAGGACSVTLPAGTYTVTATDPNGIVQTQTATITTGAVTKTFGFINAITVGVSDLCGSSTAGATVHLSATGWSATCTVSGTGCTVAPNVDLTGKTISVFVTWGGATSPTKTLNPTYINCGSLSFSFATAVAVNITGCNSMPLASASVSVTGPAGEAGAGSTDASGNVVVGVTPPIANTLAGISVTASKARFVTYTGSYFACTSFVGGLGFPCSTSPYCIVIGLDIAAGYQCTNVCADPLPTTLHANDGLGDITLTYNTTTHLWSGLFNRTASIAYDTLSGPGSGCTTSHANFSVTMLGIMDLNCSFGLNMQACQGNPSTDAMNLNWPNVGGPGTASLNHGSPTIACPPGFLSTQSQGPATVGSFSYIYGANFTSSVTE